MIVRRLRKVRIHAARAAGSLVIQAGVLLLGELGCSKNDPDGLAPSTAHSPETRDDVGNGDDANKEVRMAKPRQRAAVHTVHAEQSPAREDISPEPTSIPASGGLKRRQLKVFPGAGAGPCGCSADETCVTKRLKMDEVREETRYECVTTPATCSTDLRCECAPFCTAEMVCRLGGQAGVIQCWTQMGP